ncbi:hypothetical protein QFC20_007103 [Naganishia adeliensis]|uniref:Uncharacterized protein n=1 Tax=Naganishia adeliensis TaxID=92952 RepID=A0ACC2V311_9TREE|nr:hypothetical protein QFC20_007103 [Naganishia adeliensis]
MESDLRGLHTDFVQLESQNEEAEKRAAEAEVNVSTYKTKADEMMEQLTTCQSEIAVLRALQERKATILSKSAPMEEAERTILKAYVKACTEESEKATVKAPLSKLRETIPDFQNNNSAYEDITTDTFKKRAKAEKLKQSTERLTKGVAEEGDAERKEAEDRFKVNAAIKSKMESFVEFFKAKRERSKFSDEKYDAFDDHHSHPKIQYIGLKKGKKAYIWPNLVGIYFNLI